MHETLASANEVGAGDLPRSQESQGYLVVLQGPVDEEGGLLLHPLGDGVGHRVVGLGASGTALHTVLIVHVLLGRPGTETGEAHAQTSGCVCFYFHPFKKMNGKPKIAEVSTAYLSPTI